MRDKENATHGQEREIISVTAEVTVYPSLRARQWVFSIPETALIALGHPKRVYVVVRDAFGNLIHHRIVEVVSGPEIEKKHFKSQIDAGQLYPKQRLRLEVSLP